MIQGVKLVCGVGVNDSECTTQTVKTLAYKDGKQMQRRIWTCPFYRVWSSMLNRCYSGKFQKRNPAYLGCSVIEEWKTFSNFKAWMERQDWEGKQLDKDILVPGNKVYGPEVCVFVSGSLNRFLLSSGGSSGEYPIGVSWDSRDKKFKACCNNPFIGKYETLGRFDCPSEAHLAWKTHKHGLALTYVNSEPGEHFSDPRVADRLRSMYI